MTNGKQEQKNKIIIYFHIIGKMSQNILINIKMHPSLP